MAYWRSGSIASTVRLLLRRRVLKRRRKVCIVRSVCPFRLRDGGWLPGADRAPNIVNIFCHKRAVNWGPLSEITTEGTPKLATILRKKISAVCSAVTVSEDSFQSNVLRKFVNYDEAVCVFRVLSWSESANEVEGNGVPRMFGHNGM